MLFYLYLYVGRSVCHSVQICLFFQFNLIFLNQTAAQTAVQTAAQTTGQTAAQTALFFKTKSKTIFFSKTLWPEPVSFFTVIAILISF